MVVINVEHPRATVVLRRAILGYAILGDAVNTALSACFSNMSSTVLTHAHSPAEPTLLESLDGKWRLLYTSRPGTASPIQRTFVGVEAFSVYQEVLLTTDECPRVNNIVDFGPKLGYLKASTTGQAILHMQHIISCMTAANERS